MLLRQNIKSELAHSDREWQILQSSYDLMIFETESSKSM